MKAMACPRYDGKPHFNGSREPVKTFLPQYPQLTAAMRSVLERMARAGYPPAYTLSPAAAKASYEAGAGGLEVPKAVLARVEDFSIPARDGFELAARPFAPSHQPPPGPLYFHRRGFNIGSITAHDVL